MIKINNLSKRYGPKEAVKGISFEVKKGEIVGFLGPNGAGKSTTMNILTGYLSASGGSATIAGYDVLDDALEARRHVGYLPEQPPLYFDMTVDEYLNFVYELKKAKLPRSAHLRDICERVGIAHVRKRLIKNLSKGYKQRVGIAQALIGNPEVLILDEPTVGLDPNQIIEIRNLIKSLGDERTVILSTHIIPEVVAVCERIVIISEGEIVADDSLENLVNGNKNDKNFNICFEGDADAAYAAFASIDGVRNVRSTGPNEFIISTAPDTDIRRDIFNAAVENGIVLLGLSAEEISLENIFIRLTMKGGHA